jgi:hypothetical protein
MVLRGGGIEPPDCGSAFVRAIKHQGGLGRPGLGCSLGNARRRA